MQSRGWLSGCHLRNCSAPELASDGLQNRLLGHLPGEQLLLILAPLFLQLRIWEDVQNLNGCAMPGDKASPAARRLYSLQNTLRHTVLLILKNCPQLSRRLSGQVPSSCVRKRPWNISVINGHLDPDAPHVQASTAELGCGLGVEGGAQGASLESGGERGSWSQSSRGGRPPAQAQAGGTIKILLRGRLLQRRMDSLRDPLSFMKVVSYSCPAPRRSAAGTFYGRDFLPFIRLSRKQTGFMVCHNFNACKPFGDLGGIISNKGKMLSRLQAVGPLLLSHMPARLSQAEMGP